MDSSVFYRKLHNTSVRSERCTLSSEASHQSGSIVNCLVDDGSKEAKDSNRLRLSLSLN